MFFLSSPTLSGGVVYFGSGDHHIYAVSAESGALKWKFATGNVVHTSPAVAEGVVYAGSMDRFMYALDAATGALKWKFATGDDTDTYNQVGICSSASVSDGMVFFGARDGHFYALDAATGKEAWNVDNHHGWVIASPAVSEGVVYFPTSDGTKFYAVQAKTGKQIYAVDTKVISFSSPMVARGMVYFGTSDGWVHAADAATGAMKGAFQTDGSRANAAKYIDAQGKMMDNALYPDDTLDGMVVGMDRMYSLGSVISSPVVVDGVVYVGSADGNVYALE